MSWNALSFAHEMMYWSARAALSPGEVPSGMKSCSSERNNLCFPYFATTSPSWMKDETALHEGKVARMIPASKANILPRVIYRE